MTSRDALEKEANDHAMEHALRTLYHKTSKRDDFVAGYLQAANAREQEIEKLRARVAELEGYLSKAQVALVYFTRVRGDRILDRDCNWLMLDRDMEDAIINAHNKEHND